MSDNEIESLPSRVPEDEIQPQSLIVEEEKQENQTIQKVESKASLDYADAEQRPPIFRSNIHEVLCCLFLTFAPCASSMASGAYQTSLTAISDHFNVTGGKLTWCVSGVTLANGSCLLIMGSIADAFGRKRALLIGYSGFAIFSLIAGFMNDFILLCVFRAIQGAMVACGTPAAAGFLGASYKNSKRKNLVMSCFGIGAPVGAASGYFIAGICIEALNWRAVQYFFAIWYCMMFFGVLFCLPNDRKIDWKNAREIFRGIDYCGAFLSLSGFTLICFSLTQVDATTSRWRTPYIIALLVVGVALVIGFGIYETYVPKNPLMPMIMFKNRNFVVCISIVSLSWMLFTGILNYNAVLYFEQIRKYSVIITACCFLPQPLIGVLVNIFAGFTMHIIPGKYLITIGCGGFVVASIIWATNSIDRNYFLGPFWGFCLVVIGVDLIYNVSNRCALSSVERKLQSRAAGTFNTVCQLSSSVGLGISTTILAAKDPYYGQANQQDHPVDLFNATKYTYYLGIAISGFSAILSLFLNLGVVGSVKRQNSVTRK
ncbi:hypothetical protein OGAPHI_001296 [Ogataea philodendri]|uniref:Major facilitator superfamily (MFS) profile domain-containing protein n=1 Tax=Ogataea philodendri TaxID=1378263 RepID=A0A9P8PFU9_9ASCO|nr:uncharacterized protein OGAPHI_001296 [Ogataea philodendri]KAH3670780.1 hypothetical protein OGAPHI_001296 [Ogataea philodendri]